MMRRLTDADYSIDAVTAAKALLGAWLCRRLDDGMLNVVSSPPRRVLASPTPPRATSAANGGLRPFNNFFAAASETAGGIP